MTTYCEILIVVVKIKIKLMAEWRVPVHAIVFSGGKLFKIHLYL